MQNPITTLNQLVRNLNMGPGYNGYTSMVESINLPHEEYAHLLRFSQEKYQRIRFYDTDSIEGLITCWEPGQKSSIHNYESSVGWLKVLEGEIELQHFFPEKNALEPNFRKSFAQGDIGFLNDNLGFHRFVNQGKKRAVVLVLYSDKLERWKVWNEDKAEFEVKKVDCDLNLDKN